MNSANIVRLLDIFAIGPVNILFALTVSHNPLLFIPVFLTGVLTIWYNYINFNRFYKLKDPKTYQLLPSWIQHLFWDPVHGKTQLLRGINLLVMYPLLTYAFMQSTPDGNFFNCIVWLMALFIATGFFYNLYYFTNIAINGNEKKIEN